MQDHFQTFHLLISQFDTLYCFGQGTILHSVRFARLGVLEPEKDVGDVIFVVGCERWRQHKFMVLFFSVYMYVLAGSVFSQYSNEYWKLAALYTLSLLTSTDALFVGYSM